MPTVDLLLGAFLLLSRSPVVVGVSCNAFPLSCPERDSTGSTCKRCGLSRECVRASQFCDGQRDCNNGADELSFCATGHQVTSCKISQFECDNGQCVGISARCNQYRDCADGTDEKKCSYSLSVPSLETETSTVEDEYDSKEKEAFYGLLLIFLCPILYWLIMCARSRICPKEEEQTHPEETHFPHSAPELHSQCDSPDMTPLTVLIQPSDDHSAAYQAPPPSYEEVMAADRHSQQSAAASFVRGSLAPHDDDVEHSTEPLIRDHDISHLSNSYDPPPSFDSVAAHYPLPQK